MELGFNSDQGYSWKFGSVASGIELENGLKYKLWEDSLIIFKLTVNIISKIFSLRALIPQ